MPEGAAGLDGVDRDERVATVPRWAQAVGALLLVVFVGLSVEAYAGPGLRTRLLPSGIGAQTHVQTVPPRVFYEPGATVRVGQQSIGSEGQDRVIQQGDVVLLGATGELVRLEPGGRTAAVMGAEGASTTVANLGAWDRPAERLAGVPARYQGGRWVVDDVGLSSVGADLHPGGAPSEALTDGFWIGPDSDAGRVRRVSDDDRPAVRLRASKKSSSFMLETRQPLPTLDNVLVTVRADVRGQPGKTMLLSLEDVTNQSGDAVAASDRRPATEEWTRLTVPWRVLNPSPADRISVGLVDVEAGDWIEVRDFEVLLGVAP